MSVLVEYLDKGGIRESAAGPSPGPVTETEKARLEQFGPFIQDNPAAGQGATAMLLAGLAQHSALIAGRSGTIVGMAVRSNAVLTAGQATFRATVNGTAVGTAGVLDGAVAAVAQKLVQNLAAPIAFAKGDLLAVTLATNAGYLPITADHQAWLLIKWSADDSQ